MDTNDHSYSGYKVARDMEGLRVRRFEELQGSGGAYPNTQFPKEGREGVWSQEGPKLLSLW